MTLGGGGGGAERGGGGGGSGNRWSITDVALPRGCDVPQVRGQREGAEEKKKKKKKKNVSGWVGLDESS